MSASELYPQKEKCPIKKTPTVLFLIKNLLALFLQGTGIIPQAIFLQVIIVMPTSYFSGYFKLVGGV